MTVILPEVSDGELRKIEMPGDKSFTLTIETIDKETRTLTLEGVEHLRCNNLLLGNIIFDIQKIEAPNLSDLARVTSMESAVSEKGRDYLRDLRAAVQKGELTFLRLESSYGCVLDALCHNYSAA